MFPPSKDSMDILLYIKFVGRVIGGEEEGLQIQMVQVWSSNTKPDILDSWMDY